MSGLESTDRVLSLARDLLREAVAPAVPVELRYSTAMIAATMSIAARELALGHTARANEVAALSALYPKAKSDLPSLRRQLCRDLRDRSTTSIDEQHVRATLRIIVRERLAISHPDHRARC